MSRYPRFARRLLVCIATSIAAAGLAASAHGAVTITEGATLPASSAPTAMTVGPDGHVWFASHNTSELGRVAGAFGMTPQFLALPASARADAITAGPDDSVWYLNAARGIVGSVTPGGTVVEHDAGLNSGSESDGAFSGGIAAGADGNVWYVINSARALFRMTPSGTVTRFSVGISVGANPVAITAGPDGNLWFAEQTTDLVARATTAGVITEFGTGITAGAQITSITAGPDGNMWFTEPQITPGSLGRITPAGVITEWPITDAATPQTVTSGPDGFMWFTDPPDNVGRMSTGATPASTEYTTGVTPGSDPNGIVSGPDSALWFSEQTGNRLGHITTDLPPPPALTLTGLNQAWTAGVTDTQPLGLLEDAAPGAQAGDYTVTIDWGDGNPPTSGTVCCEPNGLFNVSGTHRYLPGTYTAVVTVDARDGRHATVDTTQSVYQSTVVTGDADATWPREATLNLSGFARTAGVTEGFDYGGSTAYDHRVTAGVAPGAGPYSGSYDVKGLPPNVTLHYRAFAITPDGPIYGEDRMVQIGSGTGELVYRCPASGICIAQDDGSHQTVLAAEPRSLGYYNPAPIKYFNPKWSPDGTKVAFQTTAGAVAVVPARGAAAPIVIHPAELGRESTFAASGYEGLAWSPDGRRLYFDAGTPFCFFTNPCPALAGNPYLHDLATGANTVLEPSSDAAIDDMAQGGVWAANAGPLFISDYVCFSTYFVSTRSIGTGEYGTDEINTFSDGDCGFTIVAITPAPLDGQQFGYLEKPPHAELVGPFPGRTSGDSDPALDLYGTADADATGALFFTRTFARGGLDQIAVMSSATHKAVPVTDQALTPAMPNVPEVNPVTAVSPGPYSDEHPAIGGPGLFFTTNETITGHHSPVRGGTDNIWSMTMTGGDRKQVIKDASDPDWYPAPDLPPQHCPPSTVYPGCNIPLSYDLDHDQLKWAVQRNGARYQQQSVRFVNNSGQPVTFGTPSISGGVGFKVVPSKAGARRAAAGHDCARATVALKGSCKVTVRFDYDTPGRQTAYLGLHESGNPTAAVTLIGQGHGFAPVVRSARLARHKGIASLRYRLSGRAAVTIAVAPRGVCPAGSPKGALCPGPALLTRKHGLAKTGTVVIPVRDKHRHKLAHGRYVVMIVARTPRWTSPPAFTAMRVA